LAMSGAQYYDLNLVCKQWYRLTPLHVAAKLKSSKLKHSNLNHHSLNNLLKNVKMLDLSETSIENQFIEKIIKLKTNQNSKSLYSLWLSNCLSLYDKSIDCLFGISHSLRILDFTNNINIDGSGFRKWFSKSSLVSLNVLILDGCSSLKDNHLQNINEIQSLEVLMLRCCPFIGSSLFMKSIASMEKLKFLAMSCCQRLLDVSINALCDVGTSRLQQIEMMGLKGVSKKGVLKMIQDLPFLNSLNVEYLILLTKSNISELKKIAKLKKINLFIGNSNYNSIDGRHLDESGDLRALLDDNDDE